MKIIASGYLTAKKDLVMSAIPPSSKMYLEGADITFVPNVKRDVDNLKYSYGISLFVAISYQGYQLFQYLLLTTYTRYKVTLDDYNSCCFCFTRRSSSMRVGSSIPAANNPLTVLSKYSADDPKLPSAVARE